MVKRTPAEVVLLMVSTFSTGDVSHVADVVSVEYVDHQGLDVGPRFGPDGFADVVAAARSGYVRLDVTPEDLIMGTDRVAARIAWRGALPDGTIRERETIDIVRVVGGLAVEHWGARSH